MEKKFNSKYEALSEYSNLTFWKVFELIFFCSRPLETFLWTLRMCWRYLKGLANLELCVSKTIMTARHANQIICQEKWKKLRFCKNEAQNGVGIFWQNLILWAETLFWKASRKFLRVENECFRYLKCAPNVARYARKKIRNIRHTNHKILTETWKKMKKKFPGQHERKKFLPLLNENFAILKNWTFWLLMCLKNFLWELRIHFRYFKHSPIFRQ